MKTTKALLFLTAIYSSNIFAGNMIISAPGKIIKTPKAMPMRSNAKSAVANAVADETTVDPTVMAKIQADFDSAINGGLLPELGDSMSWGGGTLTRTKRGELRYVNTNNGYYETTLNASTNLKQLAQDSGDINAAWISQYGVSLGTNQSKDQYDASKIAVNHVYMYGLSTQFTKTNPWVFGNGLGAYNDNGKVVFLKNGETLSYNDFVKTNEYKALAGINVERAATSSTTAVANTAVATAASTTTPETAPVLIGNSNNSNMYYLVRLKESAIDMLIAATKKYKAGTLTKEEYIKVAILAGDSAEASNNINAAVSAPGTIVSGGAVTSSQSNSVPKMRYNGTDITYDEYAAIVCPGNPQFVVCQPKEKRLQYVKDIVANATKPMPANWADSTYSDGHGEAAPEIYEASFANWKQVSSGPIVLSCDDAVTKYNLFSGEKNKAGDWKPDSNRSFYDLNGKYLGDGGALISLTHYVDKATGQQMTEQVVQHAAMGMCHK